MNNKSCHTCHYHSISNDGKLTCTYAGICHSPEGEKTAYRPMRGSLEEMENAVLPFTLAVIQHENKLMKMFDKTYKHITKSNQNPNIPQIITTCNPKYNSWLDSFMNKTQNEDV